MIDSLTKLFTKDGADPADGVPGAILRIMRRSVRGGTEVTIWQNLPGDAESRRTAPWLIDLEFAKRVAVTSSGDAEFEGTPQLRRFELREDAGFLTLYRKTSETTEVVASEQESLLLQRVISELVDHAPAASDAA